jgi:hypothetical protein
MANPIISIGRIEEQIISQAQKLAGKLNEQIDKGNDTTAFMIALLLAAFKDFLDTVLTFSGIGLIPGTNFVIGMFLTTALFFFMLSKGWFLKTRIRVWFWVLGFFVDGLPAFSVLPIQSLLVLYAWRLARKRKAKAEIKLKDLDQMTDQEITKLNNDISLLETEDNSVPVSRGKLAVDPRVIMARMRRGDLTSGTEKELFRRVSSPAAVRRMRAWDFKPATAGTEATRSIEKQTILQHKNPAYRKRYEETENGIRKEYWNLHNKPGNTSLN